MFGMKKTKLAMLVSASVLSLSLIGTAPMARAGLDESKGSDILLEAREYIENGKLQAAIIELKNALKADPSLKEARLMLGDTYLKLGNGPSAQKEFEYVQKLGGTDQELVVRIGKAYLLQGKFADIQKMDVLGKAAQADKAEAHLIVGDAFKGQGNDELAMQNYLEGEKLRPKDPHIKVGLARILLSQGKSDEAEAKVDQALGYDPANVAALIVKGELVRSKEGLTQSLSYFESALEKEPDNITALIEYAASLVELKRDEEANATLDKIYAKIPKHPLALYLSAVIETRNNNNAQAAILLDKAGPALDNFPPALLLKGVIFYAQENYAQSTYFLSRLVQLVPGHITGRRVLGATLLKQGEAQQAIDTLMPLVDAGLEDGKIYALMGSAYMQLGEFDKGTEYYSRAVEIDPSTDTLKTQLAMSKLAQGDTAGATTNLEEIVADSADAEQAGVLLTLIALREQNYEEALGTAERLIEKNPKNPVGYNLKGAALVGQENTAEARKAFNKALEVQPDFYSATMNLAQIDLREGKTDVAMGRYRDILKKDKNNVMAMIGLVDVLQKEERTKESVPYLERAIAAEPTRLDIRIRLSEAYLVLKDTEKAKSVAQQITQDFSDQPAGYEALGKINMMMDDSRGAVVSFQQLVAILEDNPGAHQLLGRAYWASEDIEQARKTLTTSLQLAKENKSLQIEILGDLSRLETSQKQFSKALAYAQQAEDLSPNSPAGPILRGRVLVAQNKNAEALKAYQEAEARGATGTNFVVEIARLEQAMGDMNTAEKTLFRWLSDHPDDLLARHSIASVYLQMGQYELASKEYEKLLQTNGEDALALNNLAWLYSQLGNSKALATAEKAYGLQSENPAIMDTYGWLLVQNNQAGKALNILQKASAMSGNNPEIRYHLAVALHKEGKEAAARNELEEILSQGISFDGDEEARKLLKKLRN